MRRVRPLVVGLLTAALGVLAPLVAQADEARVKFLAQRAKAEDFRTATAAVLELGGSNDDSAVEPLCSALNDGRDLLRQSAALALKRLGRTSAKPCLEARAAIETNDGAKVAIARAIEALSAGGESATEEKIKDVPNAKYYVSLSSISNGSGRAQTEVEHVMLKAMREKLESSGTIQIAPAKETADGARAVMSKRKMKGIYLAIALDPFDYRDGSLKVRVKIGICSYPGKAIIANSEIARTARGVSGPDKSQEDTLMEIAAAAAADQVAQNASGFF